MWVAFGWVVGISSQSLCLQEKLIQVRGSGTLVVSSRLHLTFQGVPMRIVVTEVCPTWIVEGDWATERKQLPLRNARYCLMEHKQLALPVCGWSKAWVCFLGADGEIYARCPIAPAMATKVEQDVTVSKPSPPRVSF